MPTSYKAIQKRIRELWIFIKVVLAQQKDVYNWINSSFSEPAYYLMGVPNRLVKIGEPLERAPNEPVTAKKGIETVEACTLVMLSVGNF